MTPRLDIVLVAVASLALGLGLYWLVVLRGNSPNAHRTVVMCWLLIALFTVLILFLFFPDSQANGTIFGISLGGALAAFCLVWIYGVRLTNGATKLDELEARAKLAEAAAQRAEALLAAAPKGQTPQVIVETQIYHYKLKKRPSKHVALITGNIQRVKVADVWVSSENTHMQMSRFFEGTVSGTIRYYGAMRDSAGNVIKDTIANELTQVMGGALSVQPATVLVTGAGELSKTNNVKKIFHTAAVEGGIGVGYRQIPNVEVCVTSALQRADSAEFADAGLASILFPLMGVGRGADVRTTADKLIRSAVDYLEGTKDSRIRSVYFVTRTELEFQVCKSVLDTMGSVAADK